MNPDDGPLMPRELFLIYAIAPIVTAPVLVEEVLWLESWWQFFLFLPALYLPFVGLPLAFHLVYELFMPALLATTSSRLGRFLIHFVVGTTIAVVGAIALAPVHGWLHPTGSDKPVTLDWVATCVVVSWVFQATGLTIQSLRNRQEFFRRAALEAKRAHLAAQLEAIQARTNPHFLFNGLNTVVSLIPDDPDAAERTVLKISNILRYSLERSKEPFTTLAEEIEVTREYLEVQHARFGDRLRWSLDVDGDVDRIRVPPLIFQPLIENAVMHGVQHRHGGHIGVRVSRSSGLVRVEVTDDGPGFGASPHQGTGTGLRDLRDRLDIIYHGQATLEQSVDPEKGTLVRMTLPDRAPAP